MFTNHLLTLIASGMRYTTKFFLAASFLAGLGFAGLPAARPFTYSVNGYTVVRPSELGPLTGTINNSFSVREPGHDFGAIGNAPSLIKCLPSAVRSFTYSVNGYTVVRRSELGPLTGTTYNSLQASGPGHDFGAINGASDPGLNQASINPCAY